MPESKAMKTHHTHMKLQRESDALVSKIHFSGVLGDGIAHLSCCLVQGTTMKRSMCGLLEQYLPSLLAWFQYSVETMTLTSYSKLSRFGFQTVLLFFKCLPCRCLGLLTLLQIGQESILFRTLTKFRSPSHLVFPSRKYYLVDLPALCS